MIIARFYKDSGDKLLGFDISGHAMQDEYGKDIACASVSSAVMLTCNTITEAFKSKAKVSVEENEIMLKLEDSDESAEKAVLGLLAHMYFLSGEFSGKISVKVIEKQP